MKKLTLLAALVATVAMSTSASTSAAVVTNEKDAPFTSLVLVPCANGGAGEDVLIDGTVHFLVTSTINGNNISGKFHAQPQGLKGVGQTTGDSYNATGVTQEHFKGSLQNGLFTDTFIIIFKLIGQGPDNNLLLHTNRHVTFNATGDGTVLHENTSVECR